MLVHTLAHQILGTANLNLDAEIAAELLAAVVSDDLPNTYLNGPAFSGPAAIDVARTGVGRAKIVAANTTDVAVQRALFEIAQHSAYGDEILTTLLKHQNVEDLALLQELHDYLWNYPYRSECRELIVRAAPAAHCARFAATFPTNGALRYDYVGLAANIGHAVADGDTNALGYVDQIVSALPGPRAEEFLVSIGRAASFRLMHQPGAEVVAAFRAAISSARLPLVFKGFFQHAKTIDSDSLQALFEITPTPAAFLDEQRKSIEGHYTGRIAQYPHAFSRADVRYTDSALTTLTRAFPGALSQVIAGTTSDDPQRDLIVRLALESNMCVNAVALLSKQLRRSDGSSGPLLRADQLAAAVDLYEQGLWIEKPTVSRPNLPAQHAVECIPAGAALRDVCRVLPLVDQPVAFILRLVEPRNTESVSYDPSLSELQALLAMLNEVDRTKIVQSALHHWSFLNNPRKHREGDPYEARVDVLVDSIPASELAELRDGVRYIATRLSEEFPGDGARWHYVLGLVCSARVGISKVILAAKRLG